MNRNEKIEYIKRIVIECGNFQMGDDHVCGENSIIMGGLGYLNALAEEFTPTGAKVNVYNTISDDCDAIHDYIVSYEEFTDDQLDDLIYVVEIHEADYLKTQKRISD